MLYLAKSRSEKKPSLFRALDLYKYIDLVYYCLKGRTFRDRLARYWRLVCQSFSVLLLLLRAMFPGITTIFYAVLLVVDSRLEAKAAAI